MDLSSLKSGEIITAKFTINGGGVPFVHQETFQKITKTTTSKIELTLPTLDGKRQQGPFILATNQRFEKGIAVQSPSTTTWLLEDNFEELQLSVGAAKGSLGGSVVEIWGDGKLLKSTPLLRPKSIYKEEHKIAVPIKGIQKLTITANRFFVEDKADIVPAHVIIGNPVLTK